MSGDKKSRNRYVVWIDLKGRGEDEPISRPYVHPERAEAAAARYRKKTPGWKYYVVQAQIEKKR